MTPPKRTTSNPTPSSIPTQKPIQRRHSAPPLPLKPEDSFSIRAAVTFSNRKFDTTTLPADLQRVYHQLVADHNEDYALTFVFLVRTAVELHRAWHMTLLTSKILQMIKTKFDIRCTWNLGVVKLIFRVDDGGFELHRKVPYDYDSEFQDLYMKIAVALCEEHITIHEALIFQQETKLGLHTAPSGMFLRDTPGRLLLYPLEAATCAVIFFGGDWMDAAVAAICGLAAGSMEWALNAMSSYFGSGDVKILIDVLAGAITGIIGGLFYRFYDGEDFCLSAIFLGTLYWFFYGTAFVIGLLEIVAGELETGVTRFIAVSVKTFVLTLSSAIGLMIAVEVNVFNAWTDQFENGSCNTIDLDKKWWRIPLYLLCSASALGQYRFPIANYWRGLIVQLVGYEVQYQMFKYFEGNHQNDFLDTAASNICGAAAAVVAASILRFLVDECGEYYTARLLKREPPSSYLASCLYQVNVAYIKLANLFHLGRKTQLQQIELEHSLRQFREELIDPNHPRTEIKLTADEEKALMEALVDAHGLNLWSLLMPAVYQLVPGSMIAKLWYNAVFPPPLEENVRLIQGADGGIYTYIDSHADPTADDVFYGLWVVSLSLALGLIIGNTIVSAWGLFFGVIRECVHPRYKDETESERDARLNKERFKQQGLMQQGEADLDDDPDGGGGGMTDKKTDEPIVGIPQEKQVPLPIVKEEATETTYVEPPQQASSVRLRPLQQGVLLAVAEGQDDDTSGVQFGLGVQPNNNKDEGIEITNGSGAV